MKRMLIILLSLLLIFTVACSKEKPAESNVGTEENGSAEQNQEKKTVKFCFPNGVPALTVAKLAYENPIIDENMEIEYEIQNTPDLLASKILKGEADIAIVPSNLAAQAYNKEIPYKLVGTSVWGTLYMMSTEEIDSFDSLKGKEVYSFGKNLTPDLVFKYVLKENGIDPDKDVSITYLNAASEVGPAFISGKTNLAVLSEPAVTNIMMKKDNAKVVFDFNEEWSKITGIEQGYPQASLIIKSDLLEDHKEFVDKFIQVYSENLQWAKENPEKLGEYAEKLEYGITKDMVVNGIERMNMGPLYVEDMKKEYEVYYNVLLNFAPDVIGGKLPDEEFYFER
jgi:NitT/TauT family transport system substrate-binding protein